MANMHEYRDLDRQLTHALQINGRMSLSRVAEVLGVSGQTVARRYARLRSHGALRVIGLTNPLLLGELVWLTRVRCTPDAAKAVADALARRHDTSWVQLTSGGTDVMCVVRTREPSDGDSLLLQQLPRTPRVLDVTAHCVLHVFTSGAHGVLDNTDILSAEQVRQLQPPPPTGSPLDLTDGDHRLMAALHQDGRAPLADLAKVTQWSQTTVRRRMAALQDAGVLYFDVDFDRALLGLRYQALLWLSVPPAQLHQVGGQLAEHPEVAYVAATTGPTNLVASVVCSNVTELYAYITRRIAVLPAVTHLETAPVLRTIKTAVTLGLPYHSAAH
ncbi:MULTISPECIES: Lrp/AsnC family transcriptional regulator [Kribbella]|nr:MULTISPECIES: AsnC family transcriptional regulator [Kribbella]